MSQLSLGLQLNNYDFIISWLILSKFQSINQLNYTIAVLSDRFQILHRHIFIGNRKIQLMEYYKYDSIMIMKDNILQILRSLNIFTL